MAKLLFEDDAGKSHEIKLSSISAKSIVAGDILLAHYEIGTLAPQDANRLLLNLKSMLEAIFPEGIKVVVTAMRNGKKDIDLSIVKNKKEL